MRGLYGAALGGSYLVQAAVQGATHNTPNPPRITTGAAPQLPPRRRYLTVYSTVKGTLRTQKALRRYEEMDLFFLGPTTHTIDLKGLCVTTDVTPACGVEHARLREDIDGHGGCSRFKTRGAGG